MSKALPKAKRTKRPARPVAHKGASVVRSTARAPQTESEAPRAPQQQRGQRRVDEILDAAERVVLEVGWDAASTQAIADRAGASMGSLFHFFPTKDAILIALARRYTKCVIEANERAMPSEVVWMPAKQLFERIIRAQAELKDTTPAFALIHEAIERRFGHDAGPLHDLDEALYERVRAFCQVRTPRMPPDRREASVRLMVGLVHRAMHETVCWPDAPSEAIYAVARDMLAAFLDEMDRTYGPVTAASARPRTRG